MRSICKFSVSSCVQFPATVPPQKWFLMRSWDVRLWRQWWCNLKWSIFRWDSEEAGYLPYSSGMNDVWSILEGKLVFFWPHKVYGQSLAAIVTPNLDKYLQDTHCQTAAQPRIGQQCHLRATVVFPARKEWVLWVICRNSCWIGRWWCWQGFFWQSDCIFSI